MENAIIRFVEYKGERFEISLCRESVRLFDAHRWCLSKCDNGLYLRRCIIGSGGKGVYFHRELLGFPDCNVDHENRNKFDYRKSNLRQASDAENAYNRSKKITNKSGYIGVFEHKHLKKRPWEAYVWFNYKKYFLGRFSTKEEARDVRDKKAKELHGEFAALNSQMTEAR